ncbi:hypothetical protein M1S95_22645 [Providencia rettgeri]|nr:hypothetical protein [Providencia rettgeri]
MMRDQLANKRCVRRTLTSIPSIYWYYLVDRLKGEIAPLRYRNGDPDDKLYGCIDEEGTE